MSRKKIVRITTVPLSLDIFCRGLLKELSEEYEVLAVSSPGPLLDKVREREGVRTVAVSMERRPAPLKDLAALIKLTRLFRHERPDMVHSMTPKAGLLAMMAARIAGVPVRVHTFTGLVFPSATGIRRAVFKATDRMTASCATHVIAEGKGVRADLTGCGITHKPVYVLGNGNVRGVDMRYFAQTEEVSARAAALRRKFGIPDGSFTFVFAGRLVRDKGVSELVRAFMRLPEAAGVQLLLVGEEETGDCLPAEIKEAIASSPRIYISGGWVEDVRPWLAAADALVLPSYREGFPNTVLEAGAMGLPCIVTDINGSREIIINGQNGLIVPPQDEEALFKAMERLSGNRAESASMGRNAVPLVASRFEQGYVRGCLKEFYHNIL
ncbi:MAG: glycosyltransferase family 4 protein [Bacteroidales bacterium]|nr:glycosyltransferase family 4 protein [Bacteroidales bacterium]